MVRRYSRQRPDDDPLKRGGGHGTLISSDPEGQPVTTETSDPKAIYDHVMDGGKAMILFKPNPPEYDSGYDIFDYAENRWVRAEANAFTISPDHVRNLTIDLDGTLNFEGFFNEHMVGKGMVKSYVRHMEERTGVMGDYTPAGWIVAVQMRIKPETIGYAHLIVGKAKGVRPRIDWPHREG